MKKISDACKARKRRMYSRKMYLLHQANNLYLLAKVALRASTTKPKLSYEKNMEN